VAIIRVSGPLAREVARILTRSRREPVPRMATRASVYQPLVTEKTAAALEQNQPLIAEHLPSPDPAHLLDSGILVLSFPGPASFTGEDVVELHVHGSPLIVSSVFAAMEKINQTLIERMVDRAAPSGASAAALPPDSPEFLSRRSAILACPPLLRLAQPGEFTRRAFQHGKLDLTQVEALGDLLHAETDRQRSQALIQMRGALGQLYTQWRSDLLHSLAYVEAILDFSEDEQDVGESEIWANVLPKVRDLAQSMRAHLEDHRRGELVREGISVVIIGAPNAGKSTLLNALAQRNVAIVSPVPGTTRDVVENRINIGGWACVLADTAGLREIKEREQKQHLQDGEAASADALLSGHDQIEAEGMRRTHERTKEADLKLILLDASQLLGPNSTATIDPQVLELIDDRSIVVWTKMDLVKHPVMEAAKPDAVPYSSASTAGRAKLRTAQQFYSDHRDAFTPAQLDSFCFMAAMSPNFDVVLEKTPLSLFLACPLPSNRGGSAAENGGVGPTRSQGVQALLNVMEKQIQRIAGVDAQATTTSSSSTPSTTDPTAPVITRHRHRTHVESCLVFLHLFEDYMRRGDVVLAAEQLRLATREIGKITGRVDVEELLDVIFEDFCIGK
jgi:tRNA modification GTPase